MTSEALETLRLLKPDWPDELELTPKQVLNLVVDLNVRFNGKFNNTVDTFHMDLEELNNG